MFKIDKESIFLDLKAQDSTEVIQILCSKLEELNFISPDYFHAVTEREEKYPTGLPTRPFAIAIPHGEAEGVIESTLAIACLRNPVVFRNMVNSDEALDVKIVFLLANNQPDEQVKCLRKLTEMFGDPEKLEQLSFCKEKEEMADIFSILLMDS